MSNNLTLKGHKMCLQGSDFDFKGQARALTQVSFFTIQGQVHTSQNHTIPHQKWTKRVTYFQSNSYIDREAALLLLLQYLMYLIRHSWGSSLVKEVHVQTHRCLKARITAWIWFDFYRFVFLHVSVRYSDLKSYFCFFLFVFVWVTVIFLVGSFT